jgi:hypothetical protein
MKNINFLGFTIPLGDVQDIEERTKQLIQERASYLYTNERGYTVAQAWIEATLEYLYQRAQNETSADKEDSRG